MAGFLKSVYDWLMRLFWYVLAPTSPSSSRRRDPGDGAALEMGGDAVERMG